MKTSSNGNFFCVTGLCPEISPVTDEFPSQRPVTRSFEVFFEFRLNKRLSKQSRGWWFETPSRSSWRHCNEWYLWWWRRPRLSLTSCLDIPGRSDLLLCLFAGYIKQMSKKHVSIFHYFFKNIWLRYTAHNHLILQPMDPYSRYSDELFIY